MWLYVPNVSTSFPSAQAEPDLISASSWQFRALEQFAWWRGKRGRDFMPPHSPEYVAEKRAQGHGMANLNDQVDQWATPRASDGEKGGPNQQFGAGGTPLPAQAAQWSTPSVADTTGGRKTRSGERSSEMLLNGQAEATSLASILPDHPISTVGEESSHIRRSLNPLFVEWLMGWQRGWTLLALMRPGSNDCACSATELYRYKQLMRCALSQLGLPPEAPPAQSSLFA